MRLIRCIAVLAALALMGSACGQKEGVHVGFTSSGAGGGGGAEAGAEGFDESFDDDGFEVAEEGGDPSFDDFEGDGGEVVVDAADETASSLSGAAQPSSDDGTETAPSSDGTQDGDQGAAQQPANGSGADPAPSDQQAASTAQTSNDPNDRRGVSDTELRIGIHAPLSGAAPLPQASFQTGKDQYWQHHGKVAGRDVRVFVKDDGYNPSRATSVCNAMIQQDEVFVLVGGGGADQIAACARTAAQQGVPYLSAGVDEGVLRQLPNYFATSMSYPQQAVLLADSIAKRHRPSDNVVGILRDRTPSFNNLVNTLAEELKKRGIESRIVQFQNGPSSAQAMQGFETAFPIMAPSGFLQVLRSPGGSNPQWVGVGITMGLNTVTGAACEGGNNYKGEFFSPFPGLNVIDEMDPDFKKGGGSDDIELALWGLNKSLHEVFKHVGDDITRSKFVQVLQTKEIRSGVYPPMRHTPDDHFGAKGVHILVANCQTGKNETPPGGTFVTSF
jgi:branched-chain amino acid transport system substrate-binding protein